MKRLQWFGVCAWLLATACLALAQAPANFPSKPIRFILPYPPGGGTDILGRVITQKLAEQVGQPVVPDNRPGAAGNIGQEIAAKAPPDGHTLVLVAPSVSISPWLYRKLNYDPIKDLVPVTLVASIPNLLCVHPSVPAKNLAEFIRVARSSPGRIMFGTAGPGSSTDLAIEMLKLHAKIDILMVPHKGVGQATIAMVGGHVDAVIVGTATVLPHARSGKVRALATLGEKRTSLMPDVPSAKEAGYPWFEMETWYGVLAPAGTPANIIEFLNGQITRVVRSPETQERYTALGAEPRTGTAAELGAVIRRDHERFGKLIQAAGIKPQ